MNAKNLFIVTILVLTLLACNTNKKQQEIPEQETELIDHDSETKKTENEISVNKILVLEQTNFDETIKTGIYLVDFYADWCKPCKEMHPILEKFAEINGEKIRVCKINVDNAQDICQKYEIAAIPSFIVFKDGKNVLNLVGMRDLETLTQELSEFIK